MDKLLIFVFGLLIGITSRVESIETDYSVNTEIGPFEPTGDIYEVWNNKKSIRNRSDDVPEVKLFYECMCPACRKFDSSYFAHLVSKIGRYLKIEAYPYGKSSTTVYYNGTVEFRCQHGPKECYGNTLHACVLDIVPDRNQALLYNACLLDLSRPQNGSDDVAVDQCGSKINLTVDVQAIKECAKGKRGVELLKHIGEESVKANYTSLPHLLINGKVWTGAHNDLIKDVCAAFKNPPKFCHSMQPFYLPFF